jgi:hypothetical protein
MNKCSRCGSIIFNDKCKNAYCALDYFRKNPNDLVRAEDLVKIINQIMIEIENVRSEIASKVDRR